MDEYNVGINIKTVKNASISRYSDGYNYASISAKMADDEYMSVHYEWKGKEIPEFALNVMEIMKSLGKEESSKDSDYASFLERAGTFFIEQGAKMKEKMPWLKDKTPVEEEEDDDTKKDKKKAKKKEKCDIE